MELRGFLNQYGLQFYQKMSAQSSGRPLAFVGSSYLVLFLTKIRIKLYAGVHMSLKQKNSKAVKKIIDVMWDDSAVDVS